MFPLASSIDDLQKEKEKRELVLPETTLVNILKCYAHPVWVLLKPLKLCKYSKTSFYSKCLLAVKYNQIEAIIEAITKRNFCDTCRRMSKGCKKKKKRKRRMILEVTSF